MGREVLVFSIRLGQDPYGFIGKYQGMDGSRLDATELAQKSFEVTLANKATAPRMREALVAWFEQSSSFQAAREAMGYLEKVTGWPDDLKRRIRAAVRDNYEIEHAFTVPDRVKRLLDS